MQDISNICHKFYKGTLFVHLEKTRNEECERALGSEDPDEVKIYTVANETVETR